MNTCENCKAPIADGKRFCDSICNFGYCNIQYADFNKNYKPQLTYKELDKE